MGVARLVLALVTREEFLVQVSVAVMLHNIGTKHRRIVTVRALEAFLFQVIGLDVSDQCFLLKSR